MDKMSALLQNSKGNAGAGGGAGTMFENITEKEAQEYLKIGQYIGEGFNFAIFGENAPLKEAANLKTVGEAGKKVLSASDKKLKQLGARVYEIATKKSHGAGRFKSRGIKRLIGGATIAGGAGAGAGAGIGISKAVKKKKQS